MRIGSLFAGIGGIDLAFSQAGFNVVWANEIDEDACETYRYNFPNTNLISGDIRNTDFSAYSNIDILVAGFPCQPFSICGNQKGFNDKRANLFFEIMNVIDQKNPSIIFFENVANLVEHDKGRTFSIIHNELVSRGYYIRYTVADACDYGIPQHRTRIYILAFKNLNLCEKYKFPEKQNLSLKLSDILMLNTGANTELYFCTDTNKYAKLDKFIDDPEQIYRFADFGIQKSKNGISFTLKANMGTYPNRIPIVKDMFGIRLISPKECLLLQGFPPSFDFPSISEHSKYKQAGNTVVVPLVKQIAYNIKRIL